MRLKKNNGGAKVKKRLTKMISLVMVMALLVGSMSFAGVANVEAGISARKMDLISTLYNNLHTAGDTQRIEILKVITGRTNVDSRPYAMVAVNDAGAARALAQQINGKLTTQIDLTTLTTLVSDFYAFQRNNSSEASFILDQFKEGLTITDDKLAQFGGFPTILNGIEANTYNYILFVNFVDKVKSIYGIVNKQNFNPLYVDNGTIKVYQDLLDLSDIATWFTDSTRVEEYKTRLLGLIAKVNQGSAVERTNFVNNMAEHGLIDRTWQNHNPGGPSDPGDTGSTPPPSSGGLVTAPTQVVPSVATGAITAPAVLDTTTGIATTSLTDKNVTDALASAKPNNEGLKELAIQIPKIDNAKSYAMNVPHSLLAAGGDALVTIKTDLGTIAAPSNMFDKAEIGVNKAISLAISKADTKNFSEDLKKQIGNKPVMDIDVKLGGQPYEWKSDTVAIKISFKYTPTEEELKNPENIVVWYLDKDNKPVAIPSGRYNAITGEVEFYTYHLSRYAVAYVTKTFSDLSKHPWAQKEIGIMAAKGIVTGISADKFDPQTNISRGEYIHMLILTLGLNAKMDGNFDDVSKDSPYYDTIAIAKKLGIAEGVGGNMLKPDTAITRQDMMTLTVRAFKAAKKLDAAGDVKDLAKFTDNAKIADYAKESIASMVKTGIIVGSGDKINPLGNTTRAEAAVIMYRIYNK